MPEWYKIVKARKEHKCVVCKKPIAKGVNYVDTTSLDGFGFTHQRMHQECEDAFDEYLVSLGEHVTEAEKTNLADPNAFAVSIDQVYKDEDGVIKIME